MPTTTLGAFADHGATRLAIDDVAVADARTVLDQLSAHEIDLDAVTAQLEREGVESFTDSHDQMLACIDERVGALSRARAS